MPTTPSTSTAGDTGGAGRTRRPQDTAQTPAEQPNRWAPHDADAERSILAALLTSPRVYDDLADVLEPDDFGVPAHVEIYRAIQACDSNGRPFDVITVTDELRRAKQLTRAGGPDAVADLAASGLGAEAAGNVLAHADIVRDCATRRRLVSAAREIATSATDPSVPAEDALTAAEAQVFAIGERKDPSSVVTMAQAIAEVTRAMTERRGSLLLGHSTGLPKLDEYTAGLQGGQLWLLAARPGIGKSAYALQMARTIAESTGTLVPFYSYEMSRSELTFRLLSQASGIALRSLQAGDLPAGSDRDFSQWAQRIAGLPLLLEDNPPDSIIGLRSHVRRLARRGEIGAVFVDYLQLMQGSGRRRDATRAEEVGEISRNLKLLSKELNIPVIALSQLNRQIEGRPNKRPQLSDLRESGSLEQDANVVMFLYRELGAEESETELIVAKNRSGQSGVTVPLDFDGPRVRFTQSAREAGGAPPPAPGGRGGWGGGGGGGGWGGGGDVF